MDLKDIGEALRAERERQGLSVAEVSEKTKISRRNLDAIENGSRDDLPHLVYTRGFVKNYARLLALDANKLGNALTQVYGEGDPYEELPGASQASVPLTVRNSALRKAWTAAVVLFILVGLAAGGYLLLGELPPKTLPSQTASEQREGAGQSEMAKAESPKAVQEAKPGPELPPRAEGPSPAISSAPTAPEGQPRPEPNQGGARADKALPLVAGQTGEPSSHSNTPGLPSPKAASPQADGVKAPAASFGAKAKSEQVNGAAGQSAQPAQPETANSQSPSSPPSPNARKEVPTDKGTNLVEIVASESCWLRALVDGDSRTREYNLKPGEGVKLPFSKILMVKLGNAGGVSVTYNGAPFPTNAQSGQVRTISFP